ncbi:hypothetical protein ABAC460_10890 [Asticcacaulis sp. AC460]|uniref:calcium-binding protein n=1 Tax=Asticcacaulis sp. AC460 TaxID=1282360 RepID=UPI0003C3B30E|nr:calcium-binding protein [Asticcacaulis sp. AC460]ESQ89800.1 hypothetical protein ABAC460_10890 [Asticcacaulis sp. AC460]
MAKTYYTDQASKVAPDDTTELGSQIFSQIARLEDGGYVITWSDWQQGKIVVQRYDASGHESGAEIAVSQAGWWVSNSDVIGLSDGGFLVTWMGQGVDWVNYEFSANILARRYDASGNAVGDEFIVNATRPGTQDSPVMAQLANGDIVIAWTSMSTTTAQLPELYFQRYDVSGAAIGGETRIDVTSLTVRGTDYAYPVVASLTALDGGGFVITWTSNAQDGDGFGVSARMFDASGVAIGEDFLVNGVGADDQYLPSVTALADGGYVIAWDSAADWYTTAGARLTAQRFDESGARVGGEFQIGSAAAVSSHGVKVAGQADGSFLVAWGEYDGADMTAFVQQYGSDGQKAGGAVEVARGSLWGIDVVALDDGGFAVTWTVNIANSQHIYERHFLAAGSAGQDRLTVGDATSETLTGGAGDDALQGGGGNDTLIGGLGDDTYYVDSAGDSVRENHLEGSDTVISSVSYSLFGRAVETLTLNGSGNLNGTGNSLNNEITGTGGGNVLDGAGGNDVLDGRGGDDTMIGGLGNDSYLVDSIGDDVRENASEGTDTIIASINYTLSSGISVEGLTLSGAADLMGTGNATGNTLTGNDGNNTLDGLDGDDTQNGGAGSDTLIGGDGRDALDGGAGGDVLYASAPLGVYNTPYYYIPYVSPVLDRDAGADTLSGGEGEDILSAGYGDNVDGGSGADKLFISFQGATTGITFDLSLGSQTIDGASIQNVESLGWIEGSEFNDVIHGEGYGWGGSAPVIFGMGGEDNLIAGYYTVGVYGGNGDDVVDGRYSQYLQSVEGGAGNDTLDTNSNTFAIAYGGDGDDLIHAHGRTFGGAGNDSIVMTYSYYDGEVHGDEGDDVIDGSAQFISMLFGDAGNDTVTGSYNSDTLIGGAGNDVLNGGDHSEAMTGDIAVYGGASADYLVTQNSETLVVTVVDMRDGSPDGTDTLHGVEALRFADGTYLVEVVIAGVGLGVMNFVGEGGDDAFVGSEEGNTAVGNGGNDSFRGNGGNDTLEGGAGGDLLNGGKGDDRLYAESPPGDYHGPYYGEDSYVAPQLDRGSEVDTLSGNNGADWLSAGYGDNVDGGEGLDNLLISFQGATAGVTFDGNLASQVIGGGTIQNIEGTAWIEGSDYNDSLTDVGNPYGAFGLVFGMGGNDSLIAGYYTSGLFGGDGDDLVDGRYSQYLDRVEGGAGNDTLYTNTNGFATASGGDGDDLIYGNAGTYGGAGNDTIQMQWTYYSGAAYGGDGNDVIQAAEWLGATMYGEAGNDILRGVNGSYDAMSGGTGNDTYLIDLGDAVTEYAGEGIDTVRSTVTYFLGDEVENLELSGDGALEGRGNSLNNRITGNAGDNVLDGGAGADRLVGGLGNDTYYVDNSGDSVGENHLEGTDTIISSVSYSLWGRAVETLTLTGSGNLTGTGNSLNNFIAGNDGNNTLDGAAGNDVLDGGAGADRMLGGLGDDTYYVDNAGDSIGENHLEGTDTIISSVSYSLAGRAVEILTLTGAGDLNGSGNSLNNTLTGTSGNNVLDGSGGADKMVGGLGNDTYYVDNTGDNVQELHFEGTDTVFSSVTYSLFGRAVEVMNLTGSGHINATGNSLNNTITGNSGDNRLDGGIGNDILAGGLGSDVFVFMNGTWKDTVTDFSAAQNDTIDIHGVTNGVANSAMVTQVGADVVINLGGGNTVTVLSSTQADVLSHIVW